MLSVGDVIHDLTILEVTPGRLSFDKGKARCRCVCGKEVSLQVYLIESENNKSCGCRSLRVLQARNQGMATLGGLSRHKDYQRWRQMVSRCHNPRDSSYYRYGGKGIQVCERWRSSFRNFLDDMGPSQEGSSIDRIDNSQGYSADNCRWASTQEQMNNRSNNRKVYLNGEELTITELARRLGVSHKKLTYRLDVMKLTIEQAVSTEDFRGVR